MKLLLTGEKKQLNKLMIYILTSRFILSKVQKINEILFILAR